MVRKYPLYTINYTGAIYDESDENEERIYQGFQIIQWSSTDLNSYEIGRKDFYFEGYSCVLMKILGRHFAIPSEDLYKAIMEQHRNYFRFAENSLNEFIIKAEAEYISANRSDGNSVLLSVDKQDLRNIITSLYPDFKDMRTLQADGLGTWSHSRWTWNKITLSRLTIKKLLEIYKKVKE